MTQSRKCFEDFAVGDIIQLGEKTVSRDEIIAYAREFDPAPMHLDDLAAGKAFFARQDVADPRRRSGAAIVPLGGIVASNWHVGAMFMRLFFDGLLATSNSMGSPGIEQIDWPNPVYPGDTIRFTLEVAEVKASRSRPDLGLILLDMLGINQLGAPVLVARCWTMFGRREAANAVL